MSDVVTDLSTRLQLLGSPHAITSAGRLEIRPSRPALLLLHLAWHGDWLSRENLSWLFSSAGDDAKARSQLRLLLNRARKYDWAAGIEAERNRLRFAPATDLLITPEELGAMPAAPVFLEGWTGEGELGQWLESQRRNWSSRWRETVLTAALQHQQHGEHSAAVELLTRLLDDDPLAEDALQALLRSAGEAAARKEALGRYGQFRLRIQAELAMEPLEQTVQLAAALKGGAAGTALAVQQQVSAASGPDLPLVGRRWAVEAGRASVPGLITILEGEPGIGKTRLIAEILSGQGQLWMFGRQGLQDVPWLPLTAALRRTGTARLKKLLAAGELSGYRAELTSLLPELAQARPVRHSSPHRVLEAAATLLRLLSPKGSAIVFDDAQWLDQETIRLVHYLHEQQDLRLFATARIGDDVSLWPEAQRILVDGRRARVLRIGALELRESGELLRHATGSEAPEPVVNMLAGATGGNPLMLLQAVADWRERGWLDSAGRMDWQQLRDTPTPQAGLGGLLLARVNSLDPERRRVLDAAAVLNHDLDTRILASQAALSESATIRLLGRLETAGLLKGTGFAHGYIREVVLKELPASVRRNLHRRAAAALRANAADDLLVADHLHAAGDTAAAVDLWVRVASERYAAQPGFEAEAESLYRRVLATGSRTRAWYRAAAFMAGRLVLQNARAEAEPLLETVIAETSDVTARVFALLQTCFLHYLDGELAEAELAAERAGRLVDDTQTPETYSDLQLLNCLLLNNRQKYDESLRISAEMLARLRQRPPSFALGNWLGSHASTLCMLGRFDEALPIHREQLEVARLIRHRRLQAGAINDTLATLDDLGRISEGLELGLEGLELGTFDVSWPLLLHVALARRARGDKAGALADTERLLAGDASVTTRAHGLALLAELQQPSSTGADITVARALDLAGRTELLEARVVAAISAVRFGDPTQVEQGRAILSTLDLERLPVNLLAPTEAALAD